MNNPYLTAVLNEAEQVAQQHDKIARSTDDPAHEYLRYAVLRLLEGEATETTVDGLDICGVTIGMGRTTRCSTAGEPISSGGTISHRERRVPGSESSIPTSTNSFHE